MTTRLKEFRSGARLVLKADDLLIATIMPPSKHVHIAKAIVARNGLLEFAEWISGTPGRYQHRTTQLSPEKLAALVNVLRALGDVAQPLRLDERDADLSEFEPDRRVFLRFRFEQGEVTLFNPTRPFFKSFAIGDLVRSTFAAAFEAVVAELPLDWMTTTV